VFSITENGCRCRGWSLLEWDSMERIKILSAVAVGAAVLAFFTLGKRTAQRELQVYTMPMPWSSDPKELYIGNISRILGATRSGLVSTGKKGEIQGILAENWEASDDFRVWKFHFRKGLVFETGEKILPSNLADSWIWLANHFRSKKSETTFLERLEGYHTPGPNGEIAGLVADEDSLTLRFKNPAPKLLSKIDDPRYSVTHPHCRDKKSNKWSCERKTISSGPYRITRWKKNEIELRLRPDFPAGLHHPRAAETIIVSDTPAMRASANVLFSSSADDEIDKKKFRFSGGTESTIGFSYCVSWTHPDSPCYTRKGRQSLRDRFFKFLEGAILFENFVIHRSFFPLSLPGIKESTLLEQATTGTIPELNGTLRIQAIGDQPEGPGPIERNFEKTAESFGMKLVEVPTDATVLFSEMEPNRPSYQYDLIFVSNTIDLNDFDANIRSWFLAKTGARLPDETGNIRRELMKEKLDLQTINELLWEDAIIWPSGHVTPGIWAPEEIDLSLINQEAKYETLKWLGFN